MALGVVSLAAAARADGIVVPARAVVKPARTPDQRALLRFDGDKETLVVETTVQGEGRDFAWVLPLPSAPTIEASTTGLFPTLEYMAAPEIVDERVEVHERGIEVGYAWVVAAGLAAWTFVRWRRTLPLVVTLGAAPVILALTWAGFGVSQRLYLKSPGGASPVAVLSHQTVGLFDTAVLDARDGASLRAWLDANGFRAPEGIEAVADDYARAGWVFVASKIRRDTEDATVRRIHPLAFTFATARAVYPMRLTGLGGESLALGLFVAGDRRAEAEGLTVEYCGKDPLNLDPAAVVEPCELAYPSEQPDHGELWRRLAGAKVLTKLSGVLDRAAMTRDVEVRWMEFEPKRITYVTPEVASDRARLPAAWVLSSALLLAAVVARRQARAAGRRATAWDIAWPLVAMLVGVAAHPVAVRWEPVLPAGVSAPDWSRATGWQRKLDDGLPPEICGDAARIRDWMRSITAGSVNGYSGEPVREEDSPGNWWLREADGRIELVVPNWWVYCHVLDASRRVPLEGTVRAADGSLVKGAWVRLSQIATWSIPQSGEFFSYTLDTKSDEDGRWRLDVPVGRRWHLSVVHDDHPYLLRRDVDLREPKGPLDLTLPRERPLSGRVVFADGQPVAGAKVEIARKSPFSTHSNASTTTSAKDGTWTLPGYDADVPKLKLLVRVTRDGLGGDWAWVEVSQDAPRLDLTFPRR